MAPASFEARPGPPAFLRETESENHPIAGTHCQSRSPNIFGPRDYARQTVLFSASTLPWKPEIMIGVGATASTRGKGGTMTPASATRILHTRKVLPASAKITRRQNQNKKGVPVFDATKSRRHRA